MNRQKLKADGAAAKARAARRRRGTAAEEGASKFSKSLQRAVQLPLFGALDDAGGAARPRDLYDRIADKLEIDQGVRDETRTTTDGQTYKVFQQQVRWARQTAVLNGLIAGERGRWELTEAGYETLGRIRRGVVVLIYSTDTGIALWAHAEDAAEHIERGSVKLVMTSPPYPVVKRAYGRFSVPEWLEWMRRLAAIWKTLITDDGTIAVNLMDVFAGGAPVLSPYVERFTLAAIDDVGLHLAGRMMWHRTNKLGHIEWAAKRRVVPKNTLEHLLLFSKSDHPGWKADRMERPGYDPAKARKRAHDASTLPRERPSRLDINPKALAGSLLGPLPGNLIVAGGVSGADEYTRRCRAAGVAPHPARFPEILPRQVILLATSPGEVVYDPMAGSNTTGKVAEELGRRWISSDPMFEYLRSSRLRFAPTDIDAG